MQAKQKQVIESFARVSAFLEAHPPAGVMSYRGVQETLHDVLERVREHASTELSARTLGRGELRLQQQQVARLRTRHMRPIVTIARAQIEPHSDVRLPAALRMPKVRIGVTYLLQACDAMIEVARSFESVMTEHGLPSDFLSRFRSARDELAQTHVRRAACTSAHVGARKGLQVELRRGRLAVDRLDAVVRAAFEDDEAVLATWRAAKRVHGLPGGTGAALVNESRGSEPGELRLAA